MRFPLLLSFFLLFWCGLPGGGALALAQAQEVAAPEQIKEVPTKVAPLQVRTPDPKKLQELRQNKDFQYGQDMRPDVSFWERFWRRVAAFVAKLLQGTSYDGFWKYVLYGIAIGTTVFVILKLLQVDFVGLFGKKATAAALAYETYHENIHEINFDALLEEAEAQGDFRRATRLHYLRTLKALTDAGLIHWRPGKTNWSYVQELQGSALQTPFSRITQLFEYVWYGGSTVDAQRFEGVRASFQEFNASLLKAAS